MNLASLGIINYIGKIPDLKEVLAEEGQQKRTSEARSNRRI
ncbi:hypothetical protein [Leuconostoc mesenteroides]|nr:hypothetical protein [Leuconostoc mesenteroides]